MGIRREEEMEMSDDEIEETTERKETEESGKENPALLYVTNSPSIYENLILFYSLKFYFLLEC